MADSDLDYPPAFPTAFVRTVTDVHGAAGRAWLDALPRLLRGQSDRWGLTLGPPLPLSHNYVAPAVWADGARVVLKVGVPCPDLDTEVSALRLFDGRGCVRLLAADAGRGALLLERLDPGTTLEAVADDEAATVQAANVMRRLWRPAPPDHPFPRVGDWSRGFARLRGRFGGGLGPFPSALVEEAEALFSGLLATSPPPVLLHGDLHHGNILDAGGTGAGGGEWLAIDPKGVVGDPAYEAGALLRNPERLHTLPDMDRVLARRVDLLADALGLDRARIGGWGLAQAVLSAWWTFEDHGRVGEASLAVARALSALRV